MRRLPVTTANGAVVGMISQADVVRNADNEDAGIVVREVSRPTDGPNEVTQNLHQEP